MRTLIFALMLMAVNCFGAPQPTVWLNSWDTNRGVLPVFGLNNLSISNRVAGPGGGTNWDFFGIGAATVARLLDVTNISRSIVSSSNGLYVLRINGGSIGQTATNFTAVSNATISSVGPQLNFISTDGAAMDDISVYQDSSLSALIFTNQDSGLLARIDGGGVYSSQFDANILYQINGNTVLSDNPAHQLNLGFGVYWTTTLLNPTGNGVTNNGYLEIAGPSTNWGNATFKIPSASKLASFDANKVLTNSVYSDSDIAALQAGIANTGAFVRVQSGTMNNVTSTNGNFFSQTNTAQASNQVAMTVNGLAGQVTNTWELRSNGVLIAFFAANGGFTNLFTAASKFNGSIFVLGNSSFGANGNVLLNNNVNLQASGSIVAFNGGTEEIYHAGTGTNGFGTTSAAPNGSIVASNAVFGGLLTGNVGISTLRSNLLSPTAITFPNSTVNWTNPLNCNIELYIDNTAVTGTAIKKNGTQIFGGLSNDVVLHLQPGEFFSETFSVGTPTATFSPF